MNPLSPMQPRLIALLRLFASNRFSLGIRTGQTHCQLGERRAQ